MGGMGARRLVASKLAVAVLLGLLGLALVRPLPAAAGPPGRKTARAEELFRQGKQLMSEGRIPEACQSFAESLQLDPTLGTLLNLAVCHEAEGRLEVAFAEFTEALAQARDRRQAERIQLAAGRLAAVQARLCLLTLEVGEQADVTGLELRRDGARVPRVQWGLAFPVAPGPIVITVSAPGRRSRDLPVRAVAGQKLTVSIPLLEPGEGTAAPVDQTVPVRPEASATASATRRTWGLVAGGAGVVALIVGVSCGALTISWSDESKKLCPNGECETERGMSLNSDARTAATAANVSFVLALAAAGTATYLLLSARWLRQQELARAQAVVPALLPGGAAMILRGDW